MNNQTAVTVPCMNYTDTQSCCFLKLTIRSTRCFPSYHAPYLWGLSGIFNPRAASVHLQMPSSVSTKFPNSSPMQAFSIWMLVRRVNSSSNNPFLHVKVASRPFSEPLSKCLSQHDECPAEHLRTLEPPVTNHFPPHQLFRAASRPCGAGCFVPLPATINRGRRSSRDIRPK